MQLLRAATAVGGRLPELYAGLTPVDLSRPVPYPASCSPQAWAAASPLLLLRAILGLEPDIPRGTVQLDPALPKGATRINVTGLPLAGAEVDIEVEGDAVAVHHLPLGMSVVRPA